MLTCKSFQNSSEEVADTGQLTRKIKISGPELIFDYLLHLANLIFGITVFTLLIHFDQEYASTIEKVRAASGFSMSTMIYFVCPAALVQSALIKLVYHTWAEPWKKMGFSAKWTSQQFVPKPKSKIIQAPELDIPEPNIPGPDVQNIPVEK